MLKKPRRRKGTRFNGQRGDPDLTIRIGRGVSKDSFGWRWQGFSLFSLSFNLSLKLLRSPKRSVGPARGGQKNP